MQTYIPFFVGAILVIALVWGEYKIRPYGGCNTV